MLGSAAAAVGFVVVNVSTSPDDVNLGLGSRLSAWRAHPRDPACPRRDRPVVALEVVTVTKGCRGEIRGSRPLSVSVRI